MIIAGLSWEKSTDDYSFFSIVWEDGKDGDSELVLTIDIKCHPLEPMKS